MLPDAALVPTASNEEFTDELSLIYAYRRYNPADFHQRLVTWLTATGMDCPPGATTHWLITMMDDHRLKMLGKVLAKSQLSDLLAAREVSNAQTA